MANQLMEAGGTARPMVAPPALSAPMQNVTPVMPASQPMQGPTAEHRAFTADVASKVGFAGAEVSVCAGFIAGNHFDWSLGCVAHIEN